MPYKDRQKQLDYYKKWYQDNKSYRAEYMRIYNAKRKVAKAEAELVDVKNGMKERHDKADKIINGEEK